MLIHHSTVVARHDLSPQMIGLTLAADTLVGLTIRPAQDIELLLGSGVRALKRRYTIRRHRPDRGEIDIEIFLHTTTGPGSAWAATARPGAIADFIGPKGKLVLRTADWHLFVGDEASVPAIAAITEALGPDVTTIALAEVGDSFDAIGLDASTVRWIRRNGTPAGTAGMLGQALDELTQPTGQGQAYLLGESRAMSELRAQLPRLGIGGDRAFVKGYWNR